jgi:hypothetical protein
MKELTTKNYNKNHMVHLIEDIRIDLLDIEKEIKSVQELRQKEKETPSLLDKEKYRLTMNGIFPTVEHRLKLAINDAEELRDMVKFTLPYSNKFFKDSIK